jgi:hypothetical protein
MTAKEQIIKEVYENPVSGYGSIKDSFQQAIKNMQVLHMMMLKHI